MVLESTIFVLGLDVGCEGNRGSKIREQRVPYNVVCLMHFKRVNWGGENPHTLVALNLL